MEFPSSEFVMRWLSEARIDHYVCDQCHGVHIVDLQSLDGVLESRIFVEEDGLLFTTELELRPSALMPLLADIGRLNMLFPYLKVFIDIVDDNLPRLVVSGSIYTRAGLSIEQFLLFTNNTVAATHHLIHECEQVGYLCHQDPPADNKQVH